MNVLKTFATKLDKPVTVEYAKNYLRSKGLATSECRDNYLTFILYDMHWDMYIEDGRFILRTILEVGSDRNIDCMMLATNDVNEKHWITKAFLSTHTPKDEAGDLNTDATNTTIVFSFENLCYSESAFEKIYEYAIFALNDGIDFHRKRYNKYFNDLTVNPQTYTTVIGFKTEPKNEESAAVVNQQEKRRIGFA